MYYINYFFIFSIIGHIIESFFYANKSSGILFGYWTPIYGIGVIIILLVNKSLNRFKIKNFFKILLIFAISSIALSIIEATSGYLIKWIFDKELWNYTNLKFNIGRYTAIELSLIWGLCSLLLIFILKPVFDKIVKKIPKIISYVCISLFIVDLIITLVIKV